MGDPAPDPSADAGVEVAGLVKRFAGCTALDGVDLTVPAGSIGALLGHNGAGKTTLVRILTTLERADAGVARVAGHDIATDAAAVRAAIAVVGQYAAVDELLSGRANLVMLARLAGLRRPAAARRAADLLDAFTLGEAADRRVTTYSGGMRRRLDLAASLIVRPRVLFLDEPTTGVDPATRAAIWDAVAALARAGVAVLLTTQYLEEAEALADQVVVLDHGRVIATGTASEVATTAGGKRLYITLSAVADTERAAALLAGLPGGPATVDVRRGTVTVEPLDPVAAVRDAAAILDRSHVRVRSLALREPSLDEAFAHLTTQAAGEPATR